MRSGIRAEQTVTYNITYKLYIDYSIKVNIYILVYTNCETLMSLLSLSTCVLVMRKLASKWG